MRAVVGEATLNPHNEGTQGKVRIADRILGGFEAGVATLALADGGVISWGFTFRQGNLQSVAIHDDDGRIRLLATVDDIQRLTGMHRPPTSSMQQYQKLVKDEGAVPRVRIFVRGSDDLETYLPILKRWLQADLLGFNVDCGKPGMPAACALAGRIEVPFRAWATVVPGSDRIRTLTVPNVPAAPIPLEAFRQ